MRKTMSKLFVIMYIYLSIHIAVSGYTEHNKLGLLRSAWYIELLSICMTMILWPMLYIKYFLGKHT